MLKIPRGFILKQLNQLVDGIAGRVNVGLNGHAFNTDHLVHWLASRTRPLECCASYEATSKSPILLKFHECNIAGSHFLGRCRVDRSVVYKSDVRGEELKRKGDPVNHSKTDALSNDEIITISNSFLFKTLIHSRSCNPETPEELFIRNTIAAPYATLYGSTLEGCYVGAFATVDRTALHSCLVGEFSYIQVGHLDQKEIERGTVWAEDEHYSFRYTYAKEILDRYISLDEAFQPTGALYAFAEERKPDLERNPEQVTDGASGAPSPPVLSRFAVVKGKMMIGRRVSICERAFVENSVLADGAMARENTFIINSRLSGLNISDHGSKVVWSTLGERVFTGINAFLNGKENAKIVVGEGCIIMPHTIIDPEQPIEIPGGRLVWGFIGSAEDVDAHSISLAELSEAKKISMGGMVFEGKGADFVAALKHRIHMIFESNGAFRGSGTALDPIQDPGNTQVFTIQPYGTGPKTGLYPTIKIEQ